MSENTEKRELSEQDMAEAMKAMREVLDKKAADRPTYVSAFFEMWEVALRNVRAAREAVESHPSIGLTPEAWKDYLCPYAIFPQFYFARLMGHLELPEEERFRDLAAQLDTAWNDFFASVRAHRPNAAALVERMDVERRTVHNEIVPLYTGEAATELTPVWAAAYKALVRDHAEFAEVLIHD